MRTSEPDDAALVLSARSGDPASLGTVLERHRARLLAVAVERLGHGPQAEDAVQETFVIALRHLGQLRDPAAVGPWLLAILRNVCRAQLRRPAVELTADPDRLGPAAEAGSVEEAIERAALRDWLWAALDRLPEPLRLVVVLRHFTRVSSYQAIADLCGVPVGTVRSRLNAARARLAGELLETAGPPHPDADAHRRLAEVGAALMAFQRSGDPAPLREVLAPDVSFTLADGVERRGCDRYAALLAADFEDGVRARPTRFLAAAGLAVAELRLESPPERPLHCPPALTQVYLHDGRAVRRIASHYAEPPPRAGSG